MDPQTARNAMQFLQRAKLTGAEVPAFVAVMHALEMLAVKRTDHAAVQRAFDAAVDARDMPCGAAPEQE